MSLVDLLAEFRRRLLSELGQWAFAAELANAVGHGEIVLKVHDRKIKDVELHIGVRPDMNG